jgi:hypothetical protein
LRQHVVAIVPPLETIYAVTFPSKQCETIVDVAIGAISSSLQTHIVVFMQSQSEQQFTSKNLVVAAVVTIGGVRANQNNNLCRKALSLSLFSPSELSEQPILRSLQQIKTTTYAVEFCCRCCCHRWMCQSQLKQQSML